MKFVISVLLLLFLAPFANAQRLPGVGKGGNVLVFPYYVSNFTGTSNTYLSINTDGKKTGTIAAENTANLQAYFVSNNGAYFVPLQMQMDGSILVNVKDIDPGAKGFVLVMAVNGGKIDPAFVMYGSGHIRAAVGDLFPLTDFNGSYQAWGFAASKAINAVGNSITLKFDGGDGLDLMPTSLGSELYNPGDVNQMFVTNGLVGSILSPTGASQNGSGYIRKPASGGFAGLLGFSGFVSNAAFNLAQITNQTPRIFGGLTLSVPVGTTSRMILPIVGGVGMHFMKAGTLGITGAKAPYILATNATTTLSLTF